MKKEIGVYIHIPFCMSKCSYCSFVSKCAFNEEIEEYFKYLKTQIVAESANFKDREVKTIYIGGGTPSFVDALYIEDIIDTLKKYYNMEQSVEVTIECNPCSTTKEKLEIYKKAGINRISFGVQSLNDDCLNIIGRKHNSKMALNAIKTAKDVGFDNVSCDLLIGIPFQTTQMLLNDITKLAKTGVKHISAYMLMLEQGTKLYEQIVINKELKVASDDACVNMYNSAYSLLGDLGFKRYEISNFALNGYECKHNINYWQCGEYVGFGVSAYSYNDNKRFDGFNDFESYYNYVNKKYILQSDINLLPPYEVLSKEQKIEELIMLGLRQTKGVSLSTLKSLGYNLLENKAEIIKEFLKNDLISIDGDYLCITPQNFGACNQIILNLLP